MEEQYPVLRSRLQSTFVDMLLIILLMVVFTNVLENFENVPDWVRIVLFAILFICYEPLCTAFGCTLGNYLNGIRVRKGSDSTQKINLFQAIIRYPIKISLGWVSFLTIGSDLRRRAIHDMVAGSVMIKC